MSARLLFLILALAPACNSSEVPVEPQELGTLEYEIPTGWQSTVRDRGARKVVEWVPKSNPRKESITLVYSEPLPAIAHADPAVAMRHLADAQRALEGSFGDAQVFTSKHGLPGARIEGSFTPSGEKRPYRRTHALVLADDHVLHLLYTAPLETAHREVFDAVIHSLQRKGA